MGKGSKFFMTAIFAAALGLGVLPGCGKSASGDGVSGSRRYRSFFPIFSFPITSFLS